MNNYKFGIYRDLPWGGYAVYLYGLNELNKPFIAENIQFRTLSDEELMMVNNPLIRLDELAIRNLAQEIWNCGIKPEVPMETNSLQDEVIYLRSVIDKLLGKVIR